MVVVVVVVCKVMVDGGSSLPVIIGGSYFGGLGYWLQWSKRESNQWVSLGVQR